MARDGEKLSQPPPEVMCQEWSEKMSEEEKSERWRADMVRTLIKTWAENPREEYAAALFLILEEYLDHGSNPPRALIQWTIDHWHTEPASMPVGRPETTDDLGVAILLHREKPNHPDLKAAAKAIQRLYHLPYGPRTIINRYNQQLERLADDGYTFEDVIKVRKILENSTSTISDQT